jgi:hypothetical protein
MEFCLGRVLISYYLGNGYYLKEGEIRDHAIMILLINVSCFLVAIDVTD